MELAGRCQEPDWGEQWWGPKYLTTTIIDKMEARYGGVWRFVQRDTDGNEFAFHGFCHEIPAPDRKRRKVISAASLQSLDRP